jgi:hypothetical protein
MANGPINRRAVLGGVVGAAGLAALPAFAQDGSTEFTQPASASVRNNISSFRILRKGGEGSQTGGANHSTQDRATVDRTVRHADTPQRLSFAVPIATL